MKVKTFGDNTGNADVVCTTPEGDWVLRIVRDAENPRVQRVVSVLVKQQAS